MKAPFTYLRIKIGGNHKRLCFWEGVIENTRKRLGKWKGKFMLMAKRIYLIKVVLTSIPLFYISCFYMSVSVLKELEKRQRNLL